MFHGKDYRWTLRAAVLALVGLAGCDGGAPEPKRDPGDTTGIKELGQPLKVITSCSASTGCDFTTGKLTVTLEDGDVAVISKHPTNGNILVNDIATPLATVTTVKTIDVVGVGGGVTVIMDFANGTFCPGTATAAGITIDWGAGTGVNNFKLRGNSTAADTVTAGVESGGAQAISFNTDALKDIVFKNSVSTDVFTFSLGGGNDVFAADAANAILRIGAGATAFSSAVTVYGGPGDDIFTGGLGNDFFYGDIGNDTFKGGSAGIAGTKTFSGGAGIDTADFSARPATESLVFTLDGVPADPAASTPTDAVPGLVFDGTDTNADGLAESELNDIMNDVEVVKGGAGDDVFYSDSVTPGAGIADGKGHAFYGGAGIDTVDYTATPVAITVTMGDKLANDGVQGSGTAALKDDVRDDIENIRCPAAAVVCKVIGNALDNTIFVDAAGAAASDFSGGAGIDTVDFSAYGNVDVTMDGKASLLPLGLKINTDIENIKCGLGTCKVVGNALNNHIWGSTADVNTISSGDGDDVIEDVTEGDDIDCGDGSDILIGLAPLTTPLPVGCEL